MRSTNKNASYFDDDFEVTYEEEIPFDYNTTEMNFETQRVHPKKTVHPHHDHTVSNNRYHTKKMHDQDYEPDYHSTSKRHRRYRPTQLAAPIQKGGNAILILARTIIRNLSLILMLAILILMGYNFLRGSAPYGDIQNAISTNTYTQMLAAYFSVVAALMLYEIISMFWAMTKVRIRDEYGVYHEDVGRGLFSFIFLYLCSHTAFFIYDWIPETFEILKGVRGALNVFGSMHNVLFGLCLAGVISCLFRKYSLSL